MHLHWQPMLWRVLLLNYLQPHDMFTVQLNCFIAQIMAVNSQSDSRICYSYDYFWNDHISRGIPIRSQMDDLSAIILIWLDSEQTAVSQIYVFSTFTFARNTAVSTKVVQLKSIKAYATIPKGMMGCGCSLLHRQVHEFSARWKVVLWILVCVC